MASPKGANVTNTREAFNRIYRSGGWPGGKDDGTASGHGSTLKNTTEARSFLAEVIRDFGVRSIFDAPCGDYHWMQVLREEVSFDYFGGDIADVIIQGLNEKYANNRTIFTYHDITTHPFMQADLWLCRDCLFHLPTALALAALQNFKRSRVPYAVITTHELDQNRELPAAGNFRPVDLTIAPFNLPRPILSCREADDGRAPRYLGFWTRDQVLAAKFRVD